MPLIFSVPYLKSWLTVHPDRRGDQWLFGVSHDGKITQMSESAPNAAIRYIGNKAGLRRIHPHMLRHSRLTELATNGLGEYQLKGVAGWTPNSRMSERYIHLSGRDNLNAVLQAQGVETKHAEKPQPILSSAHCPNCDAIIGLEAVFCPSCGFVLDEKMRLAKVDKVAELESQLKATQEQQREILKLLARLQKAEEKEGQASG